MAEEKRSAKSRKIVDVAHPGKSAPSPNSRSVIISHRPIMRDPMMIADQPETAKEEVKEETGAEVVKVTTSRTTGGVLKPLTDSKLKVPDDTPEVEPAKDETETPAETDDSEATPEVEADTDVDTDADADAEKSSTSSDDEPTPAKPAAAPKHEQPASTGSAGTDAKLGTKDAQSDVEIAAAEDAEAKRQAHIQEMIETKKYYLPINTVEKKRTKQFVAAGIILSLLLAAAWLDIALDAGLIKIGHLKALTHFFN